MHNLDRLDLLEEKLLLFRSLTFAAARAMALAVLIVACSKSALAIEIKVIVICSTVLVYVLFAGLTEAVASLATAQNESAHFAQLSMISLEFRRLWPNDVRTAVAIQTEVEQSARNTFEYSLRRGTFTGALAHHGLMLVLQLLLAFGGIAITWLSWGPAIEIIARLK